MAIFDVVDYIEINPALDGSQLPKNTSQTDQCF